jgi:hypothetical protein
MEKIEVPSWLYTERDTERRMIGMLESGELRTHMDVGQGMVDDTELS